MARAPPGAPYSRRMSRSSSTQDSDGGSVTVGLGGALGAERAEVATGATLGRFVVLEEVGRGAMGRVLRAYDPKLQREVALKLLRGDSLSDEGHARLVREAQAMARLSHPNVVAVHDVEDAPEGVVLVMEYVDGATLQQWLQTKRPWAEVLACFLAAGRGLAAAHVQGLLHRDFKPANVLVASDGRVKVTDFGLAKATGPESPSVIAARASASTSDVRAWSDPSNEVSISSEITRVGTVMGTPRYMAPEQHCGEPLDGAADQYAFCVALWEALAGADPFAFEPGQRHRGGQDLELLKRKHAGPGAWSGSSDVPRPVIDALRRGLAPEPNRRWPDMSMLLARLAEVLAPRRRRRELLALGLAGGLAAGALAWLSVAGLGPPAEPPCSGARAQLGDAWDDARREEVHRAILATGTPYAPGVATYVDATLQAYAEAWVAAHREACEATTVRGEQSATVMDLRMACLHRAQVGLRAATGVLATADAAVVEHAHELARELDPLERCADVDALRAAVEPPDADKAAAVDEVRASLAEAAALTRAGHYEGARTLLDTAAPEVDVLGYEPLRTELELARGAALQETGDYEATEAALRAALRLGTQQRQWPEVRRAALRLMYVVGYQRARPDEALRYRELAEGLVDHGDEPAAGIALHNGLGTIAFRQGRFAEAETEMRRAAELSAALHGFEDLETLGPRGNMALAQYRQGQLEPALAELRRVAARHEELLGPDHPATAETLANVGIVLNVLGHHDEGEAVNRRVLDIRERTLGYDHPDLATALNNLSSSLHGQGRFAEAATALRRSVALLEQSLGPEHPTTLASRGNLAVLLKAEGKLDEAEAEYRRVIELEEKVLGLEHPNVAGTRGNLANLLQQQGRHTEAEAEQRRALAVVEATVGADSLESAHVRHNLAMPLKAQGRLEEAEAEMRRAVELREQLLPADNAELANSRQWLAEILLVRDRAAEAQPLAEAAWRVLEHEEGAPGQWAEAAFVLARVLEALAEQTERGGELAKQTERARELARRAERGFAEAGPQRAESLAEVRTWLRTR
jgi:tetratricopeptide (TPR) repeat protein